MANPCDFYMKVNGKKKNVRELVKWFNANYDIEANTCDAKHHFYNIRDFMSNSEFESFWLDQDDHDLIEYEGEGFCDWSVYECLFAGTDTYYKKYAKSDSYGTHIVKASKILNLEIEIFGIEVLANSVEHYVIKNGELVLKELKQIFTDEYSEDYLEEIIDYTI